MADFPYSLPYYSTVPTTTSPPPSTLNPLPIHPFYPINTTTPSSSYFPPYYQQQPQTLYPSFPPFLSPSSSSSPNPYSSYPTSLNPYISSLSPQTPPPFSPSYQQSTNTYYHQHQQIHISHPQNVAPFQNTVKFQQSLEDLEVSQRILEEQIQALCVAFKTTFQNSLINIKL
ncbi:hypothetical protein P8452_33675 [Trifolium repens]|nr:hypothetical protein P8452_33675 [Trifolium repens]